MSSGSSWNDDDETFHLDIWDRDMLRKTAIRMIFSSTWLGIFATVAVIFAILSTKEQRKGPVFIIQCISFPLAIIYNLQECIIGFRRFIGTFAFPGDSIHYKSYLRVHVMDISMEHFVPIISDLAVLCKIRSFYPFPLYSYQKQALILSPFILLLLPRLGLSIALTYAVWMSESTVDWRPDKSFPGVTGFQWVPLVRLTAQIEYALQAIYCAGTSTVLIHKALCFSNMRSSQLKRDTIKRRLRFFVEALLMSFIPPVAFSIAAASLLECPATHYCYYREMSGSVLNTSILFGLLATSWSSIRVAHDSNSTTESKVAFLSDGVNSFFNNSDFESRQFISEFDSTTTTTTTTKKGNGCFQSQQTSLQLNELQSINMEKKLDSNQNLYRFNNIKMNDQNSISTNEIIQKDCQSIPQQQQLLSNELSHRRIYSNDQTISSDDRFDDNDQQQQQQKIDLIPLHSLQQNENLSDHQKHQQNYQNHSNQFNSVKENQLFHSPNLPKIDNLNKSNSSKVRQVIAHAF